MTLGPDVQMVVDLRPRDLLNNPDFRKLAEQLSADDKQFKAVVAGDIEQILVIGKADSPVGRPVAAGVPKDLMFLIRATGPYDWTRVCPSRFAEVNVDGMSYVKAAPTGTCFRALDARTLFIANEADIRTPPLAAGRHDWDDAWKRVASGAFRVAGNAAWFDRMVDSAVQQRIAAPMLRLDPLLKRTQALALSLNLSGTLGLDALTISASPDDARRVAATLQALVTLGQDAMPNLKTMAQQGPPEVGRTLAAAADAMGEMLAAARVEREEATTRLRTRVDSVAPLVALLAPAAMASNEATKRAQSVNNMKQIGLAMHNFASVQEGEPRFPPAVLIGPKGHPYSWRVALLPLLEQQALYDEYRFDEPWDGPNNRKLIERMPAVFHDPGDDEAKPGHASYFALTGAGTAFPDRPQGMSFREMIDGTSNTILVVEARRPIAWTDPDDILVLPAGPFPVFGGNHPGGANALFADGSVRFLKDTIGAALLRALITPSGGEVLRDDMQ